MSVLPRHHFLPPAPSWLAPTAPLSLIWPKPETCWSSCLYPLSLLLMESTSLQLSHSAASSPSIHPPCCFHRVFLNASVTLSVKPKPYCGLQSPSWPGPCPPSSTYRLPLSFSSCPSSQTELFAFLFLYLFEYCHNFSSLSSLDFLTSSSCPFFVSNFKNRFTEV